MHVDWIVAVTIFLFFTGWSFYYYDSAFSHDDDNVRFSALQAKNAINDYLLREYYETPVVFSSAEANDTVLYLDYSWDRGYASSALILNASNGAAIPCEVSGDRIYWKSNLSAGLNNFTLSFYGIDADLKCNATFDKSVINQTTAFAEAAEMRFSQESINQLMSTGYDSAKNSLGLSQDFRLTIKTGSGSSTLGPQAPAGADVYSLSSGGRLLENGGSVNLTLMVW